MLSCSDAAVRDFLVVPGLPTLLRSAATLNNFASCPCFFLAKSTEAGGSSNASTSGDGEERELSGCKARCRIVSLRCTKVGLDVPRAIKASSSLLWTSLLIVS